MSTERVRYERDGHVATITYDRPEKLNAIDGAMRTGLNDAFDRFRADDEAWVGIITGEGRAFCVGADAGGEGNPAGDSPVAGLTEVRSVRPDAQAGLLSADIGGIAEIGVAPGVSDGRLTLTPEQTELIGIPLPDGLFSGITGTVDSTVAALPGGVSIHGARVVPDGLEVALIGTDVTLR